MYTPSSLPPSTPPLPVVLLPASHCRLRQSVLWDPRSLQRRFRAAGLLLLALSPFLSLFLLTLLLLRKAEQLYHQPAAASARAWSNAAKWTLRAYNEVRGEARDRDERTWNGRVHWLWQGYGQAMAIAMESDSTPVSATFAMTCVANGNLP